MTPQEYLELARELAVTDAESDALAVEIGEMIAQAQAQFRATKHTWLVLEDALRLVCEKRAEYHARAQRWRVKRIAEDLLPDAYWIPDMATIQEHALNHRGEEPPPSIPGVIFERVEP